MPTWLQQVFLPFFQLFNIIYEHWKEDIDNEASDSLFIYFKSMTGWLARDDHLTSGGSNMWY